MFAPVWDSLVTNHYPSEPAVLGGYRRFAVSGEEYPVIVPDNNHACVQGVVYFAVSPADLARLDDFEGAYYQRKAVYVIAGSKRVLADVYALHPDYYNLASNQPWDAERFSRTGIYRFMERYKGFE
jgi:gamma-glutamylcyclotransferase (GGCT)/AIG2-like uncharacterized protein YtfP